MIFFFLVLYSDNRNILWQFVVLFFCKNFRKFENWPRKKVKYGWGEERDILEGVFIPLMSDFYINNDFLWFLVLYSDNRNILYQFVVIFYL